MRTVFLLCGAEFKICDVASQKGDLANDGNFKLNILFCNMRSDLGESVESQTCDIFSFLFDWKSSLGEVHLAKNPT